MHVYFFFQRNNYSFQFFTAPRVCFVNVRTVLITSYHFKHLCPGHCPLRSSPCERESDPVASCQTNFLRLFLNKTPLAHLKWNTTTSFLAPKLKIVHLGTPVCPTTHKHGQCPHHDDSCSVFSRNSSASWHCDEGLKPGRKTHEKCGYGFSRVVEEMSVTMSENDFCSWQLISSSLFICSALFCLNNFSDLELTLTPSTCLVNAFNFPAAPETSHTTTESYWWAAKRISSVKG